MITAPDRTEAADYYFTYIDKVPAGNVLDLLDAQTQPVLDLFRSISDEKSLSRYAPDKWSIRDVVNHLSDAERLFVFRAFWFARGFDSPLPSFDQNIAVNTARADDRPWSDLVGEFAAVREATRTFFRSLPSDAWMRRGVATEKVFSVRALAYITVGHVTHHESIIRERYL
jgi:hypothetical protein